LCRRGRFDQRDKRGNNAWLFNLVVTVIAIFISASVFAQDAKLIEATKKEGGKVVLYGSLEPDTTEAIIKRLREEDRLQSRILASIGNPKS
jgi:hypothetical protein